MRVIVDAMGTDNAPLPEVMGVVDALDEKGATLEVILVGDEKAILSHLRHKPRGLEIVHTPKRVLPHEKATDALRHKRDSSVAVGLEMLRQGRGDAFISAGNTGAVMAFSLKTVGLVSGVKRPAIAAFFPRIGGGYNLVLDVGANPDVVASHMFQFAVMGTVVYRNLFGAEKPRVGILSVGEEAGKGNALVKKTKELLEGSDLDFVGNVEGHELLADRADVVVMDGFVGNVILKFGEGIVSAIFRFLKEEIKGRPEAALGALLMKRAIHGLLEKVDFEEYGGAPLLGVNGLVFICHGRSSPKAIKNAIRTVSMLHEKGLVQETAQEVSLHL